MKLLARMFIPSYIIVHIDPIKQPIRGKSGYDEANPGVVNPVLNLPPVGLDFPLATKYGNTPPCPVQNIIFDVFVLFALGKKPFISSHFVYSSELVEISL
jgi:hypothetical protein